MAPEMADELRAPQQAVVGTKTRSAGRAPCHHDVHRGMHTEDAPSSRPGTQSSLAGGFSWMSSSPGRHCEINESFRESRRREARQAREARPPHHPGARRGRLRTQSPPARQVGARGADGVLEGPGDPGRGGRRPPDGGPRPRGGQDGRADASGRRPAPGAPRTPCAGLGRPGPRRDAVDEPEPRRRSPTPASARSGRSRARRRPVVVREKTHPAADDARPGALRDGAGRPRLLPFVDNEGQHPAWSTAGTAMTTGSSRSTSADSGSI